MKKIDVRAREVGEERILVCLREHFVLFFLKLDLRIELIPLSVNINKTVANFDMDYVKTWYDGTSLAVFPECVLAWKKKRIAHICGVTLGSSRIQKAQRKGFKISPSILEHTKILLQVSSSFPNLKQDISCLDFTILLDPRCLISGHRSSQRLPNSSSLVFELSHWVMPKMLPLLPLLECNVPVGSFALSFSTRMENAGIPSQCKIDFVEGEENNSHAKVVLHRGDIIEIMSPCFIQDSRTGQVLGRVRATGWEFNGKQELSCYSPSILQELSSLSDEGCEEDEKDSKEFIFPVLQSPIILLQGHAKMDLSTGRNPRTQISIYSFWKLEKYFCQ